MSVSLPGPDGFLLDPDDPLFRAQLRLNDYLLAEEQRDTARTPFNMTPWRKIPARALLQQVEAILRRLAWLDTHDAELETAHLARTRLATLLRHLHKTTTSYPEPELCRLLDLTTALLGRIEPYGPVERVVGYLKDRDLTPGLCAALRRFQSNLREEMSINQASMQSLRQTLHVLLWLDEWDATDPARCWSECVRRDFRAMEGTRRVRWRALLKHIRGNAPLRMPAGWAKDAKSLLVDVGPQDFREAIGEWFAPFRSPTALPLSVAGSHVLKGLIWYCAVAEDKEIEAYALWLLDVKWKQKRNTEKAMVALRAFGVTKEELLARQLIKPSGPSPVDRLLERMAHATAVSPGNHVRPDGDDLIVHGQLHFYRLSRTTGRVWRVTDGATLDLSWAAIPDQLRLVLRRECDSEQQVALRACLLVQDGVFGRYFQVK
jgi:hypothetical protein